MYTEPHFHSLKHGCRSCNQRFPNTSTKLHTPPASRHDKEPTSSTKVWVSENSASTKWSHTLHTAVCQSYGTRLDGAQHKKHAEEKVKKFIEKDQRRLTSMTEEWTPTKNGIGALQVTCRRRHRWNEVRRVQQDNRQVSCDSSGNMPKELSNGARKLSFIQRVLAWLHNSLNKSDGDTKASYAHDDDARDTTGSCQCRHPK